MEGRKESVAGCQGVKRTKRGRKELLGNSLESQVCWEKQPAWAAVKINGGRDLGLLRFD